MEREFEGTLQEQGSQHESEMRKVELQYREIIQGLESEVQKLRMPDEPKILTSNDALKVDNRLNEEFQSIDGQLKSLKDQYEADIKAMRHQNQLDVAREKEENNNYVEALTREIALITSEAENKDAIITEMKSKINP